MITPSFSPTATERVLPKLALDFTTASLDSRVAFTRTTSASNPATYVNSSGYITSATNNQPRFDYDPVTLACKGLLIEESRINTITYSQEFSDSSWTKNNATITSAAILSPDGTLNGIKLVETATTGEHRIYKANSGAYVRSIYAKAGERTWLALYNSSLGFAYFDLANGVLGNVGAGITATITPAGNGWYRCSTYSTTTYGYYIAQAALENGVVNYAGDNTKGIYIWGAQSEVAAFPTSYIPTTTAALTRNADVATMTGTNFSDWYNVGAGSWYIQTNARNASIVLTAGAFTLTANATALKKYANSYATDQSATSLVLGRGTAAKVFYYKQALLAAELAALVN